MEVYSFFIMKDVTQKLNTLKQINIELSLVIHVNQCGMVTYR